jgi:hypothetical protein
MINVTIVYSNWTAEMKVMQKQYENIYLINSTNTTQYYIKVDFSIQNQICCHLLTISVYTALWETAYGEAKKEGKVQDFLTTTN